MTKEEFEECLEDTYTARWSEREKEILGAYIKYHNELDLDYPDYSPRFILDNLYINGEIEYVTEHFKYMLDNENSTELYDKLKEIFDSGPSYFDDIEEKIESVVREYNDNIICLAGRYNYSAKTVEEAVDNLMIIYSFGV